MLAGQDLNLSDPKSGLTATEDRSLCPPERKPQDVSLLGSGRLERPVFIQTTHAGSSMPRDTPRPDQYPQNTSTKAVLSQDRRCSPGRWGSSSIASSATEMQAELQAPFFTPV